MYQTNITFNKHDTTGLLYNALLIEGVKTNEQPEDVIKIRSASTPSEYFVYNNHNEAVIKINGEPDVTRQHLVAALEATQSI